MTENFFIGRTTPYALVENFCDTYADAYLLVQFVTRVVVGYGWRRGLHPRLVNLLISIAFARWHCTLRFTGISSGVVYIDNYEHILLHSDKIYWCGIRKIRPKSAGRRM